MSRAFVRHDGESGGQVADVMSHTVKSGPLLRPSPLCARGRICEVMRSISLHLLACSSRCHSWCLMRSCRGHDVSDLFANSKRPKLGHDWHREVSFRPCVVKNIAQCVFVVNELKRNRRILFLNSYHLSAQQSPLYAYAFKVCRPRHESARAWTCSHWGIM